MRVYVTNLYLDGIRVTPSFGGSSAPGMSASTSILFTSLPPSGIMEDIRDECSRYGTVVGVEILRPVGGMDVPGYGNVLLTEFVFLAHLCGVYQPRGLPEGSRRASRQEVCQPGGGHVLL